MIVRVLTEGQYELKSENLDRLNKLDNEIVEVVAANNDVRFAELYEEMLHLVRHEGKVVSPAEIHESDLILPAPDITMNDARKLFIGGGLIPG